MRHHPRSTADEPVKITKRCTPRHPDPMVIDFAPAGAPVKINSKINDGRRGCGPRHPGATPC